MQPGAAGHKTRSCGPVTSRGPALRAQRHSAILPMASRGVDETERLRRSIETQLNRLLAQLEDLNDFREELDADECVPRALAALPSPV